MPSSSTPKNTPKKGGGSPAATPSKPAVKAQTAASASASASASTPAPAPVTPAAAASSAARSSKKSANKNKSAAAQAVTSPAPAPVADSAAAPTSSSSSSSSAPTAHSRQLDVHRLRFGDWVPSTIKCIAVDPAARHMVAVGRTDGDIEIYNSRAKWHQQVRIAGKKGFKLQQLVWAAPAPTASSSSSSGSGLGAPHRLFGISLRGFIFEVDLKTLTLKNVRDTYGGTAWSVVATTMPAPTTASASASAAPELMSVLCVGCEDGAVKVFRYEDSDSLEYVKSLPSLGCRVLSLAVNNCTESGSVVGGLLYAGCSDGTIRCIDKNSGRHLSHMTGNLLTAKSKANDGAGAKKSGGNTHIWSLALLSDHTIVSGDNKGCVQLWDGRTGVLMQSIHQHTAEVLALAVSPDENCVFASGVDCRVVCIRRIRGAFDSYGSASAPAPAATAAPAAPTDSQWVYSSAHRPHSHDVFALAICTVPSTTSNTTSGTNSEECALLSGGVDTKMCQYSISTFHSSRPLWIIPIPPTGRVDSSSCSCAGANESEEDGAGHKLVAIRHSDRVDLWHVRMAPVVAHKLALQQQTALSQRNSKQSRGNDEDEEEGVGYYGRPEAPSEGSSSKKAKRKEQQQKEAEEEAAAAAAEKAATAAANSIYGSDLSDNCSLVVQLRAVGGSSGNRNHDFVHATALSPCGRFLAVTRTAHTSLYRINRPAPTSPNAAWSLTRVTLPDSIALQLSYRMAFNDPEATGGSSLVDSSGVSTGTPMPPQLSLVTDKGSLFLLTITTTSSDKVVIENCINHFAQVSNNITHRRRQQHKQQVQGQGKGKQNAVQEAEPLHYAVSALRVRSNNSSITASDATSTSNTSGGSTSGAPGNSWIVACDSTNFVYVYDVTRRMKLHWTIAAAGSGDSRDDSVLISSVEFFHNSRDVLVLLMTDNTLRFFNIAEKRQLPAPWADFAQQVLGSSNNDGADSDGAFFPSDLTSYPAALPGLAFLGARKVPNSTANPTIVVHGQGCIVLIHPPPLTPASAAVDKEVNGNGPALSKAQLQQQQQLLFKLVKSTASNVSNYQQIQTAVQQQQRAGSKRKHESAVQTPAALPPPAVFTMLTCYRSLIHVTAGAEGQLVLLENPWVNVLEQLPDTLARKRYAI